MGQNHVYFAGKVIKPHEFNKWIINGNHILEIYEELIIIWGIDGRFLV